MKVSKKWASEKIGTDQGQCLSGSGKCTTLCLELFKGTEVIEQLHSHWKGFLKGNLPPFTRMWRPEHDLSIFPQMPSTMFFETGSLTDLELIPPG